MKKRTFMIFGLMLLFVFLAGTANATATRVAVIGFESADSDWFTDSDREEEVLENIAWLLNDKLAEVDEYTVLNRNRMLNVLDDVRYTRGRRPTRSIINQLRNRINATLFIFGSLDEIEVRKVDEFKFGPIEYTEVEVTIDLSIDMINAQTARVFESFSGSGSAKESGVNIVDSRGDRIRLNLVSDERVLERAIERAVTSLIASIKGEEEPQPVTRTVEAEIVSIVRNNIIVNKGERDGLEVGQVGEIIRPGDPASRRVQDTLIGEAEITDLDRSSAILQAVDLDQNPEVGDRFNVEIVDTVSRRPSRDIIELLETRNFVIEIIEAVQENDRVTILGMAYAKTSRAELELILDSRSFFDQEGRERPMSGRRVSIGPWTNSSRTEATIKEIIYQDEPVEISWSFTGVPESTEELARVNLGLRTSREGRISIELEELDISK